MLIGSISNFKCPQMNKKNSGPHNIQMAFKSISKRVVVIIKVTSNLIKCKSMLQVSFTVRKGNLEGIRLPGRFKRKGNSGVPGGGGLGFKPPVKF
jgi:hypothetical protein